MDPTKMNQAAAHLQAAAMLLREAAADALADHSLPSMFGKRVMRLQDGCEKLGREVEALARQPGPPPVIALPALTAPPMPTAEQVQAAVNEAEARKAAAAQPATQITDVHE